MKRFNILHETNYHFSGFVQLLPHTLRLRPREGHELRIESSVLEINPTATLRWHRDVEGNSVAVASFSDATQSLNIKSETTIQQYDQAPLDFLVEEYAVNYPFYYLAEDQVLLKPYMHLPDDFTNNLLKDWLIRLLSPNEKIQTVELLLRLNQYINQSLNYQMREEEGVQTVEQTLTSGMGSCRDYAWLFMAAARQLGLAARFVSGYIHTTSPPVQPGSTHAWAEVFIPGAGWKGFDPTSGLIAGSEHIAVAVARLPGAISPIEGSFLGPLGANMFVNVQVTALL